MSMSDEKCRDIAETSWLEENYLPSKSPVLQSGAPVYYTDTVSLPIEKQYKLTCLDASGNGGIISPKPFIVPHNETSPPPPSHGSPAVCSQYTRNQISSSVPSSLGKYGFHLHIIKNHHMVLQTNCISLHHHIVLRSAR